MLANSGYVLKYSGVCRQVQGQKQSWALGERGFFPFANVAGKCKVQGVISLEQVLFTAGAQLLFFFIPVNGEYRKTRAVSSQSAPLSTMEFIFYGSYNAFHLPDRGSSS